jgi:predicted O-methyltransferase YrrM
MGMHGVLHTFEYSEKHAKVASESFHKAGVAARAHIHVGPALQTLHEVEAEAPFDLVFIDADKSNNPRYVEWALRLTRAGSLIVVDNVVRHGRVADAHSADPDIVGSRAALELIAEHPRLTGTALQTVGAKGYDGFALARVL